MSTLDNIDPQRELKSRRYHLLNIINIATGFPYNRIENEVGGLLDFCLENNYNDRTTLGTCFARLWERYSILNYIGDGYSATDDFCKRQNQITKEEKDQAEKDIQTFIEEEDGECYGTM